MGRITPEAPRAPERRACSYCRRFGAGELCEGCGAPIDWSPASSSRSATIRIDLDGRKIAEAAAAEFGGFEALQAKLEELDASGRVLLDRLCPLPSRRPDTFER